MIKIDASKIIGYQNLNNLAAWKDLVAAVHKLEEANPTETIQVDVAYLSINDVNEYIKELILDDKVQFICVKNNVAWKVLTLSAQIHLRTHDLDSKFIAIELQKSQTLNKKELAAQKQRKMFNSAIDAVLADNNSQSIFVMFSDITKNCGLNNLMNACKELPDFFKQFCAYCKEKNYQRVVVSMRNVEYNPNIIDAACKAAIQWFANEDIELIFSDCDAKLTATLKLYRQMAYSNGTIDDAREFVENLGLGRVCLLTMLKPHRSDNTRYREKDEVEAQYIGIITQITPTDVTFSFTGFGNMLTFHDLLARYGDIDEFDQLVMNSITINYADLGITSIRIANKWHLNLFDGAVKGNADFHYIETYTSESATSLTTPEKVLLPEFLRRSLKSWHINFNEEALIKDRNAFQKALKQR